MSEEYEIERNEEDNVLGESPADKFRRLGNKRLPKAVKSIQLLRNLTNPGYEWDERQATIIITTLENEIAILKRRLLRQEDEVNVEQL